MSDAPDVSELLEIIRVQQQSIERLVRLVEQQQAAAADDGASGAQEPPKKPAPVDWFTISGPERLAAWKGLAEFVAAFVARYNVQREIRPCWYRHPTAVEELTALWHLRQAMYGPDASLNNAMAWQGGLAQSLDRLRSMFASCRERHLEISTKDWMSDEIQTDFYHAIRDDVMNS